MWSKNAFFFLSLFLSLVLLILQLYLVFASSSLYIIFPVFRNRTTRRTMILTMYYNILRKVKILLGDIVVEIVDDDDADIQFDILYPNTF